MKKIRVFLITGIICFSVMANASAQIFKGRNSTNTYDVNEQNSNYKSAHKISTAVSKSLNAFNSDYRNDRDVKWFSEKNVRTATFTRDSVVTNVVYDKKGRWLHTIKTYQENKLDRSVRALVKSNYFDDNISGVKEINEGRDTFYLIYLENDKNYKIVSVINGELNVYQQFNKQS